MTHSHQITGSRLKAGLWYIFGVAMIALIAIAIIGPPKAKAADLNGNKVASAVDESGPAILHSGCGFGVGFNYLDAMASFGTSKVGIGSSGEEITPSLECHYVAGALFLGASAEYGFAFGDISSLSSTTGLTGEAMGKLKVGVMLDPTLALYAHGDYGTAYLKGMGVNSVNEFGGGVGLLKRLPTSMPLLLQMEYSDEILDLSKFSSNLNGHEQKFGMSLIYQFYSK